LWDRAGAAATAMANKPLRPLKPRQQLADRATGARIVDELHRSLPERWPSGIALHHDLRDLRQP
jgi:Ser/Thr protein kinase RdoA (MazF antagonist)